MMKRNYQKELDVLLNDLETENKVPTLLLHSCCAPCSSYVLEYLTNYFNIILYYYNPNISEKKEFDKRVKELENLIQKQPYHHSVRLIEGEHHPEEFYECAKGLEKEPEKGKRCYECYKLRLRKTAELALKLGADYFTTTLSISPMKNADWLNEIGEQMAEEYHCHYLVSDFKKKGGYQRSIVLSKEYDLYRQDFCGCIYSKVEREKQKQLSSESN